MPGSGTVTINVSNRTEGALGPIEGTSAAVTGGTVLSKPKNITAGNAKGQGGSFRAAAEVTQPLKGVVVYDCPDENKVIILFAQFIPQGSTSTNIVKVGIYDKENTKVDENLVKHVSENPSVKGDIAYKYTDESQNKFLLTIKATIKNDDDNAEAVFTISQDSR